MARVSLAHTGGTDSWNLSGAVLWWGLHTANQTMEHTSHLVCAFLCGQRASGFDLV